MMGAITTLGTPANAPRQMGDAPLVYSAGPAPSFDPYALSGLALRFDASSASSLRTAANAQAGNGQAVDKWLNLASASYPYAQVDGFTQAPTLISAGLGGLPILHFPSEGGLTIPTFDNAAEMTAFAVSRLTSVTQAQIVLGTQDGEGADALFLRYDSSTIVSGGTTNVQDGDYVSDAALASALSWAVLSVTFGQTSGSLVVETRANGATNGPASYAGLSAAPATGPFTIGHGGEGSGFLNGDLAEILVYSRRLSDTDRASVEAFLKTKWGLP